MLDAIGLTPAEAAMYRELVSVTSATAAELARQLDASEAECEALLEQLQAGGLASRPLTDQHAYVAVAPEVALRGALVARQAELHRAEAEVANLTRRYELGSAGRVTSDVIDLVSGWEEVQRRGYQVNAAAESLFCNTFKNPMLRGSAEIGTSYVDASKRGVPTRLIFEGDGLDPAELSWGMRQVERNVADMRVVPSVPVRMMIADRRIGLVALDDRPITEVGAALLVHPSGLLSSLIGLFELLWAQGLPVNQTAPVPTGLTPLQFQVINLLVAGFTDRAIAGILKSSERSVQRHVRQLMDLASAQSRVQLGWHASEAGWLRVSGDVPQ